MPNSPPILLSVIPLRSLLLCAASVAFAQPQSLSLKSPNGEIELRLFIATAAEDYSQPRAAYQVDFHVKAIDGHVLLRD